MAFQTSPGIVITEKDFTDVAPNVSTSIAGFAGVFKWGPVNEVVQVGSENELVSLFGKPDNDTYEAFFSAANFLAYSNNLRLVRVISAEAENASSTATVVAGSQSTDDMSSSSSSSSSGSSSSADNSSSSSSSTSDNIVVKNQEDYDAQSFSVNFIAKYPGKLGNSLHVSLIDDADLYDDDWSSFISGTRYDQAAAFNQSGPNTSTFASNRGSSNDELHIIIRDANGSWTGTPGTVLERFSYLSKASDAVRSDGTSNYYKNVLNVESRYVWWGAHPSGGSNWGQSAEGGINFTQVGQVDFTFSKGKDGNNAITSAEKLAGFNLLADPETLEIDLLITGEADQTVARGVVDIASTRKDCVAFVSPELADVSPSLTAASKLANVLDFEKNVLNKNTSYAFLDSGWKYQYDQYNDTFRYIPLNADIAGLCARTDVVADPWFSPAGFNRGQIKNVIKLAYNPTKADRDELYKNGINPVISLPGSGTLLFGDKTLLEKPSAFDRINVRRLFLVLQKIISTAAKAQLFEFNDDITRTQFVSIVEPFLRDVQGRRGLTDFKVICDETNNTQQVIDRNEFVADIYVKPTRSINYITLNFIATRSTIGFNEIG